MNWRPAIIFDHQRPCPCRNGMAQAKLDGMGRWCVTIAQEGCRPRRFENLGAIDACRLMNDWEASDE